MHRIFILSALVLGTALIVPVVATADDRDHHEKRYRDRNGHDYHTWNNNEDRAYRLYLEDQHRKYRDFDRAGRGDRDQYFRWRHNHPDNSLFKIEIR